MGKDAKYVYEQYAFWVLLGVQQVVTLFAFWRLGVVLRIRSSALALLYLLVLLFSLGTA